MVSTVKHKRQKASPGNCPQWTSGRVLHYHVSNTAAIDDGFLHNQQTRRTTFQAPVFRGAEPPGDTTMAVDINAHIENLRIDDIHAMLSKVFWSPNITKAEILKGIKNSALVVGAYRDETRQIGFLLVVSDTVRFAYLMDVVVQEDYRRQGIGQRMVNCALSHPDLKDVYQWLLITKDAHGVYEKCGFTLLKNPEKWMSILSPRPDRPDFMG